MTGRDHHGISVETVLRSLVTRLIRWLAREIRDVKE